MDWVQNWGKKKWKRKQIKNILFPYDNAPGPRQLLSLSKFEKNVQEKRFFNDEQVEVEKNSWTSVNVNEMY